MLINSSCTLLVEPTGQYIRALTQQQTRNSTLLHPILIPPVLPAPSRQRHQSQIHQGYLDTQPHTQPFLPERDFPESSSSPKGGATATGGSEACSKAITHGYWAARCHWMGEQHGQFSRHQMGWDNLPCANSQFHLVKRWWTDQGLFHYRAALLTHPRPLSSQQDWSLSAIHYSVDRVV